MGKNYYDILGVSENTTTDEIKRSFRVLAKKYHPDRNHGNKAAEQKFKEISEAYDTLSDSKKKAEYDTMRKYGAFTGAGSSAGTGGFGNGGFDFSQFFRQGNGPQGGFQTFRTGGLGGQDGLEDILASFFGGGSPFKGRQSTGRRCGRRAKPHKPQNVNLSMSISFREAALGTTRIISLSPSGRKLSVRVPAGIDNNGKIRLAGQGRPGINGSKNSDLIITVHIMPDQHFERKGNDVYTSAKMSFKQAILGCKVEVKTLSKTVSLSIPPGTQSGTVLRLKGLGLAVGDIQGDHYVRIEIEIPKTLTEKQRKLLEEWDE
ncbi:MAG: J domain-containing protein [candidate division Zixibacteria bacterium]|nr:J domain-containing protein [candidate division Zixibacteria bacterium]